MKKLLSIMGAALLMASCTEDYKDWATPFSNGPEEPINMAFSVAPADAVDFATVTTETVQLFVPTVTAPEGATTSYLAAIAGEDNDNGELLEVDGNGFVKTADLEDAVNTIFGRRPVAHNAVVGVEAYISLNGSAFKYTAGTTLSVTPNAPVIEEAYYITGNVNGWDNNNTDLELSNGGADPYENPVFTCLIPAPEDGGNVEFKVTPKSGLGGDWSKCLTASDTDGKFATDNAGGNLVIAAVEGAKFYRVTFNMLDQTWSSDALSFNQFVYFIGATDGWTNAEQKLESPNFDGVYTGYVYCADPNGWGNQFKFQRVAGSWDNEINSETFSSGITGDFGPHDGDTNIEANAGEGVYYVTLDLANLTLNAVFITNMNLVGDFNGWNNADDAQQMTWDAENYCFVIEGAGVNENGWKFTTNNSWDVNLGADDSVEPSDNVSDLVANGKNLGVVGTTIKLYPTRRDSDNIYCTVE
jgi:hypothetical protein